MLRAALETRISDGWTAQETGASCSFFFAARGDVRLMIAIETAASGSAVPSRRDATLLREEMRRLEEAYVEAHDCARAADAFARSLSLQRGVSKAKRDMETARNEREDSPGGCL